MVKTSIMYEDVNYEAFIHQKKNGGIVPDGKKLDRFLNLDNLEKIGNIVYPAEFLNKEDICVWESGGSFGSHGYARIVGDPDGQMLFAARRIFTDPAPNSIQAMHQVYPGCYMAMAHTDRGNTFVGVFRITNLLLDDDLPNVPLLTMQLVYTHTHNWIDSKGSIVDASVTEELVEPMVKAAIAKSNTVHCKETHFTRVWTGLHSAEKVHDEISAVPEEGIVTPMRTCRAMFAALKATASSSKCKFSYTPGYIALRESEEGVYLEAGVYTSPFPKITEYTDEDRASQAIVPIKAYRASLTEDDIPMTNDLITIRDLDHVKTLLSRSDDGFVRKVKYIGC